MDMFLGKVTQQAMNYAIRSGVALTASYAIRQSAKLLDSAPKSNVRDELFNLQQRLQHKIRIVSPAIDMIELIAARGNTSLESAVSLTKDLRLEIQNLGQRLAVAADASENAARSSRVSSQMRAENELELMLIVADIKRLLERIEDAVPLINLAITTSGASLSVSLPQTVSPSRLLQASTFLTAGDTQYSLSPQNAVQIGPTFTLTVYMLFAGHDRPANEEDLRETTWKEVIHKARVKLRRVPLDVVLGTGSGSDAIPSIEIESTPEPGNDEEAESRIPADARADEYAYQLMIIEDFDDDRVHEFESDQTQPGPFDDVRLAGIREMIPIHEVSKIFYADTSKVLNIGTDAETNHPVLLLKRDLNAVPPCRMVEREGIKEASPSQDSDGKTQKQREEEEYVQEDHAERNRDPWRLPPSLDPEWIAFEVYTEAETSDDESDTADEETSDTNADVTGLSDSISRLNIKSKIPSNAQLPTTQSPPWVNAIKTSLSLLELLLRLTSLQQFQQQSHLSINDELLNFFLEESASTGAGGDEHYRQAVRADARRRVGWDPYNESPLKRRGEDYQYYDASPSPQPPGAYLGQGANGNWSPAPAATQTRSITGVSDSASPSPLQGKGRSSWLKRQDERKGSPLKSPGVVSDEGIGTSPVSGAAGSMRNENVR